ncbi:MAG: hypothetical protein ABJO27_24360 [Pseudoruegeria sp.]
MTIRAVLLSAVAAVSISSVAQSAEIVGSNINLEYTSFPDVSDLSSLSVTGSVEVGVNRNFSVQLDAGAYNSEILDDTGTNIAAHAIYHTNEFTSLGAYVSSDEFDGERINMFGVEGGTGQDGFDFEGYLGFGEEQGVDVAQFGILGRYVFDNNFGIGWDLDLVNLSDSGDDVTLTRTSLRGDYSASENVLLYAEVGSLYANVDTGLLSSSGSETFVGIGAEIAFGKGRGATFNGRSLGEVIPGF